jgi:broad-specificity NMP kinase
MAIGELTAAAADASQPPIYYIVGPPGVGKRTLARLLETSPARAECVAAVGVVDALTESLRERSARERRRVHVIRLHAQTDTIRRRLHAAGRRGELDYAERVAWVLEHLYPVTRCTVVNAECPPELVVAQLQARGLLQGS